MIAVKIADFVFTFSPSLVRYLSLPDSGSCRGIYGLQRISSKGPWDPGISDSFVGLSKAISGEFGNGN
jgi:hypothetical protein